MKNNTEKDYIIVENKKNVLLRFNNLILEIFEYLRKENYYTAKDNYDELKILYNKLVINEKKKIALKILLKEINSITEFNILKQKINQKIKKQKLIRT